jgi:hypothetical protein
MHSFSNAGKSFDVWLPKVVKELLLLNHLQSNVSALRNGGRGANKAKGWQCQRLCRY